MFKAVPLGLGLPASKAQLLRTAAMFATLPADVSWGT